MEITKTQGTTIDAIPTDEEVFPCPFCGSENVRLVHTWTAAYWVECENCGAQVDGDSYPHDRSEEDHRLSAQSAIEAWNKRAPMPNHMVRLMAKRR